MPIQSKINPRRLRNTLAFVGLSAFVVVTGSVTAYRHYFRRPGELATNLIPADALAVVTLDTNPAPDQVALFKRIQDAIKSAGLSDQLDSALQDMTGKAGKPGSAAGDGSALLRDARPYLSDNFALALYEKSSKDIDGILYVAVNDRAKIQELLDQNGAKTNYRSIAYVKLAKENLCVQLRDNYLLLSDSPDAFVWANGIAMARQRPISSLPEYQEARAALPADASLLVFVAPKALQELQNQTKGMVSAQVKNAQMPLTVMPKWMAYSATVRDPGLAIDYRIPMDAGTAPYLKTMAEIAAVPPDALRHLPSGAYTVSTAAQPGKYFTMFRDLFATDKKSQREMDKTLADMQKETGINLESDVVPALNGDFTVAMYPDANHADGVMDAVALADDANDANPAALAEKVRLWVEKASGEKNKKDMVRFVPSTHDGATFWYLDAQSQKALSKSLDDIDPTETHDPNAALKHTASFDADHSVVNPNVHPYLSEKTVAYAQVGKAFIIATSKPMLDRAVQAYEGHGASLADDPGYADMERSLTPGSQSYMLIHLGAIMQRLQPELKKSLQGEDAEMANDMMQMFGSQNAGIAISGKYDGKMSIGSILIPLNYDKMIRVMGKAAKKAAAPHDDKVTMLDVFSGEDGSERRANVTLDDLFNPRHAAAQRDESEKGTARANMQTIANAEQSYKLSNLKHEYTAVALGATADGPIPADWKRLSDFRVPVSGPGDRTYKVEFAKTTPRCKDGRGVMQKVPEWSFSVASSVEDDGCFIPGVTRD